MDPNPAETPELETLAGLGEKQTETEVCKDMYGLG